MVSKYLFNNRHTSSGVFSEKIQKAIDFAARAHKGQKRKVSKLPYVIHPLGIALILARLKAPEETIIAGLLHDVVEDCGVALEEISEKFGTNVARIVDNLTEKNKNLPWETRKQIAIEHISEMKQDSLLVKSADILYNLSDIKGKFKIYGDKIFEHFNAQKEKQLERYKKLIKALNTRWKENPLLPEIKRSFRLFKTDITRNAILMKRCDKT